MPEVNWNIIISNINAYNKENKRLNDDENDTEKYYKKKSNKSKNNFLRSTNYAGSQLKYNNQQYKCL